MAKRKRKSWTKRKPRVVRRRKKSKRSSWWKRFLYAVANVGTGGPANLVTPVISGYAGGEDSGPEVGETLTVSDGEWLNADVITYQWLRDDIEVPGATSNEYLLTNADLGFNISAVVIASNDVASNEAFAEEVGPVIFTGDLEIESVTNPSGITVFYNTSFASLSLPETVIVQLEDDSEIELDVTWDTGDYTATSLTTQPITGTIELIDGVLNTGGHTATINVTVEAREILSAPSFDDLNVANGTVFGDLDLPATGIFILEDSTSVSLAITWAEGSYDEATPGTYTLEGTPTLVTGVINPGTAVKAEIDVIVSSADAPSYSASTFGISGGKLGGSLTYLGSDLESNIPPRITEVILSGTLQENEEGTITITVENNTSYAILSASISIYHAANQQSGSEGLSGTVDPGDITIDGNEVTGLYTFAVDDVGKFVRAECTVTLDDGGNDESEIATSLWSDEEVEAAEVVGGITYFGSASNPADNGSVASTPVAVTPPASMQAGDLVILVANTRTASSTLAMSNAGGQTWNALTNENNAANNGCRMFWARFNGTWSSDPSVSFPGSVIANTVVMHVFRPSDPDNTWAVDVAMNSLQGVAAASGVRVNIEGITTVAASTVSVAVWATPDDNTWGNLIGAWDVLGAAQYRNVAGSDISSTFAYKVRTSAGPTGDVSKDQLTVTGDNSITQIVAFKEVV